VSDTKFGAPNFWDYLIFDAAGKRVYASHIDKIEVMDATTGKSIGHVGPFHDAHGIAVVTDLGKGYADSGDDGVVKVFSLTDFHVLSTIKVSADADGMLYDSKTRTVLVVAGDSKNLTIINPAEDKVVKAVPLPGKPEFFAIDGEGHAFVNIADTGSIAKIDLTGGTVVATWPMAGCTNPHGLAYDPRNKRLFSGCANGVMIVVDATNGKNLASVPIGDRSDAVVVDSKRRRAISANGDGTLTVVSEDAGGGYSSHPALSYFGGRNAAIAEDSGTLYVAHGNMKLMSSTKDLLNLRFGWNGMNLAILRPND
jgi:DNA-binding beta-propeller fold protein YncE